MRLGKAFPVRLFGFSLFWTWLFLVAVSPSPLFGLLRGVGDTPFEVSEVGFRVVLLACAALFSKRWANPVGVRALSGACVVAGPLSVAALLLAGDPVAVTVAGALAAVADVAMFLMWMCFFGYAKLGETALLLALSYAFGSLLCLLAVALGDAVMMLFAAVLPVASALAFMLSTRYSLDQGGEVLFGSVGQDAPARPRSLSPSRALPWRCFCMRLRSRSTRAVRQRPNSGWQAVLCCSAWGASLWRAWLWALCAERARGEGFIWSTEAFPCCSRRGSRCSP